MAKINILDIITKILINEGKNPDTSLTPTDAKKIAPVVAEKVEVKVKEEVKAIETNLANQEPWYQSRVIVGTLISLLSMGASFVGKQIDMVDQGTATELVMQIAGWLGAAYALYGRLVTNKPIGV